LKEVTQVKETHKTMLAGLEKEVFLNAKTSIPPRPKKISRITIITK